MLAFTKRAEQGFRACTGILRLAKSHSVERLEAACERALDINARSYASVKSILKNNLERRRRERATDGPAITHPNIRRTRGAPTHYCGAPLARRAGYFH